MKQFQGRSQIDFTRKFDTEEKCKKYLAELKWKNGFNCPKCGHVHAWDGKPFTKVCKSCRYIESATANTLFHKVKFGLSKAFLILFEIATTTKSCSSPVLAAKFEITQKTAWLFMTKVRQAMDLMDQHPLAGNTKTIRALVGDKKESSTGRGPSRGKPIMVILETSGNSGIIKGYSINLSKKESGTIKSMKEKVQAFWKPDITNLRETSGQKQVHRFLKGMKSWLTGVHHQVSSHYLQGYLNEYSFRFNQNRNKNNLFHILVDQMMKTPPATYKFLYNN